MIGLLTRARNNVALTPAERALLKLIEGLACTALVAALPIVADALGHGAVNWADVGRAALAAGATAALLALIKLQGIWRPATAISALMLCGR